MESLEQLLIGGHLQLSKNSNPIKTFENIFKNQEKIVFQVFANSPRTYTLSPNIILQNEIQNSKNIERLYVHSSYLVNISNPELKKKNKRLLMNDINFLNLQKVKNNGIIIHIGNKLQEMYSQIMSILTTIECLSLDIIIENTCESSLEDLEELYLSFQPEYRKYIYFCIDTAHLYMKYGYNTCNDYYKFFNNFNDKIGIERISVIHLNDCERIYGKHKKDKHCCLGDGNIFMGNFTKGEIPLIKYILKIAKTFDISIILETPDYEKDYITINKSFSPKA